MARFKYYSYDQTRMLPISFSHQILPGTFEHTLNYLIDCEFDLSIFEDRYKNDETGAPAYDPAILLKIILFAYSRGITSSRRIERCCRENIIFMALSADTHPHFTTIANFISTLQEEIVWLFREVLLIFDDLGMVGREMFAIDGCKLPSNASKEWSGTREEFANKRRKMEKSIRHILKKHSEMDALALESDQAERERGQVETLRKKVRKIREWMDTNEDKVGAGGRIKKSNITDNESAKMKTSHGVIQGYTGVAAVDKKNLVIVHGEAFGEGQESSLLEPMITGVRENFREIEKEENIYIKAKVTADSGFHSEKNMKMLSAQRVDGYVADTLFRKRDPRFAHASRYKPEKKKPVSERFTPADFEFDPERLTCTCPAGKKPYLKNRNAVINGRQAVCFQGAARDCGPCRLRKQCLRDPKQKSTRQVYFFRGRVPDTKLSFTERMKRKIDSPAGRDLYGQRLAAVEPVFGNIRTTKRLDRFSLRGKSKVDVQWKLFCMVHNLGKIHRVGFGFR